MKLKTHLKIYIEIIFYYFRQIKKVSSKINLTINFKTTRIYYLYISFFKINNYIFEFKFF